MKIRVKKNGENEFFVEYLSKSTNKKDKWVYWLPEEEYDQREHSYFKRYYRSVDKAYRHAVKNRDGLEQLIKNSAEETYFDI